MGSLPPELRKLSQDIDRLNRISEFVCRSNKSTKSIRDRPSNYCRLIDNMSNGLFSLFLRPISAEHSGRYPTRHHKLYAYACVLGWGCGYSITICAYIARRTWNICWFVGWMLFLIEVNGVRVCQLWIKWDLKFSGSEWAGYVDWWLDRNW